MTKKTIIPQSFVLRYRSCYNLGLFLYIEFEKGLLSKHIGDSNASMQAAWLVAIKKGTCSFLNRCLSKRKRPKPRS